MVNYSRYRDPFKLLIAFFCKIQTIYRAFLIPDGKMKIAVLGIRGLPSSYSGFETFVGELTPRLASRGHEITVYCRKKLYTERPVKYKNMRMVYLPSIENKFFSTLSHSFISILHATMSPVDIIFVVNSANGFLGVFPKLFKKKSVLNVDGMEWLRPKWNRLGKWVFKTSARAGTKLYDEIVTDADEMHRLYAKEFGINSKYIAYGANIETSKDEEVLEKFNLKKNGYYLIASRLVPDNNAEVIVEGFLKSNSKKKLAIAGGANYKGNRVETEFYSRLKSISTDKIRFLGHIDNPRDIIELHCNAFGYIHGHQYGGINPALLKALGCGNFILANDTPFNREVLDHGKYGALFQKNSDRLAEMINRYESDNQAVLRYRRLARKRIEERFTWEQITDEYETFFKMCLKNNRYTAN
jgi:glycosyltransferase involved in cell wall biosynthesis